MKFSKILISTLIVALGLVACATPKTSLKGSIAIDGSSTVYPIAELVTEDYNADYPNVEITVGFSGTGGGFTKFAAGEIDIANASRKIKQAEIDALVAAKVEYLELKVAYDGLSVVVNKQNTWVDYLTFTELKAIFGKDATATKWSDVRAGWPEENIVIYSPGHDSGTFDFFTEAVNGKSGVIRQDSETVKISFSEDDNILVTGVAGGKGAIGYFGFAYFEENADKLKVVPLTKDPVKAAVTPVFATIADSTYPLSRPLFIYVNKASLKRAEVMSYVTFFIKNAKKLSAEVGYVSLPDADYTAGLALLK
ncbi:MAG: phosphate binding protein [Erysipelotrichaceae bacterium]|nr:MAG: phosphate binding [Erysipelotrichaceae bacterium]TXT19248.1 MAG: phosphate binding protein [Erysipelotrichaceae bacterium]